jgi:hypothetical protein
VELARFQPFFATFTSSARIDHPPYGLAVQPGETMLGCINGEGGLPAVRPGRWRLGAFVRRALGVVSSVALFCGACAVTPVTSPVEYASPEGQPAGYYPGLGTSTVMRFELAEYLTKNQAGIADVQNRIVQIREGGRTPGCIGEDKYTCVATLAQKLAITDDVGSKDFNLFVDVRYDVNGRPINSSHVFLDGFIPNYTDITHRSASIDLALGADGTVSSVEAKLIKGVDLAQTQDEYDATGVYEIVWPMSAKQCPSLSKGDVDRWVENVVKPSVRQTPEEHGRKAREDRKDLRAENIHNFRLFDSRAIVFCGRTFQFTSAAFTVQHGFKQDPAFVPTVRIQ